MSDPLSVIWTPVTEKLQMPCLHSGFRVPLDTSSRVCCLYMSFNQSIYTSMTTIDETYHEPTTTSTSRLHSFHLLSCLMVLFTETLSLLMQTCLASLLAIDSLTHTRTHARTHAHTDTSCLPVRLRCLFNNSAVGGGGGTGVMVGAMLFALFRRITDGT